jgi:N-acetylmuramic acid 6-phosphate etherase
VPGSEIPKGVDVAIVPVVGPEAITGSTRMKSGTAQKMVLNMISTVAMIRLGYVKGNRMTNLKSSNLKLRERSLRILSTETGFGESESLELFEKAGGDLRIALVMAGANVGSEAAEKALAAAEYNVGLAVESVNNSG